MEAVNRLQGPITTAATAPRAPEGSMPQGSQVATPQGPSVTQGSIAQGTQSPTTPETPATAFNNAAIKDLTKRVYSFPEGSKLQGPSNFD